jgi:transcriptional regulator GlxA family with amidase domain
MRSSLATRCQDEETTTYSLKLEPYVVRPPLAVDERLRFALNLMRQPINMSVKDIASALNLSVSRFQHIFKQQTGVSPARYQKMRRLLRARQLLNTTFFTVKQVMAAVELADPSHFSRDYKQLFRETPSKTRQEKRNIHSRTAILANKQR